MRLKIAVLKWHLGLPGANELKLFSWINIFIYLSQVVHSRGLVGVCCSIAHCPPVPSVDHTAGFCTHSWASWTMAGHNDTMDNMWTVIKTQKVHVVIMTKMSLESHHWSHWTLECLFKSLFRLTSKKHQRSALLALCEGNPPDNGGFPSQRASNVCFHFLMSSWYWPSL